jgi:signal transduction histidine kinase
MAPPDDAAFDVYRFTFEKATDPTLVIDDEGRVRLQNDAARALPDEVAERLSSRDSQEMNLFHRALTARGHAYVEIDVAARTVAVEGRVHGGQRVVTLRDRSEARRLESQILALQRAESLGQFTASLAHDFNNLLTPIACLSSSLEAELPRGGRAWEMARDIRIATEKAAGLARQALGLLRREPVRARAEPVCVNAVVADMRALIERVVGADVRVEVTLGVDAGSAKLERARLERALLDLAVNARDAMQEGGRLTMTTARVSFDATEASSMEGSNGSDYVCLRMTDTGSGMTPEVRARIFEPFFTTKDPGRGTGLGLSAVRRFVADNGGCIAVHTQPGNGTTMVLYFPSTSRASQATC